jgi:hypothetical protein
MFTNNRHRLALLLTVFAAGLIALFVFIAWVCPAPGRWSDGSSAEFELRPGVSGTWEPRWESQWRREPWRDLGLRGVEAQQMTTEPLDAEILVHVDPPEAAKTIPLRARSAEEWFPIVDRLQSYGPTAEIDLPRVRRIDYRVTRVDPRFAGHRARLYVRGIEDSATDIETPAWVAACLVALFALLPSISWLRRENARARALSAKWAESAKSAEAAERLSSAAEGSHVSRWIHVLVPFVLLCLVGTWWFAIRRDFATLVFSLHSPPFELQAGAHAEWAPDWAAWPARKGQPVLSAVDFPLRRSDALRIAVRVDPPEAVRGVDTSTRTADGWMRIGSARERDGRIGLMLDTHPRIEYRIEDVASDFVGTRSVLAIDGEGDDVGLSRVIVGDAVDWLLMFLAVGLLLTWLIAGLVRWRHASRRDPSATPALTEPR